MQTFILNFTLLIIFSSGFGFGYYFGLLREHKRYMKSLNELKETLSDIDREHRKEIHKWESRLKN